MGYINSTFATERTNMTRPARVICFSRDERLLETRGWVLDKHFDAAKVSSVAEIENLKNGEAFDLLILCHSLSEDDCRQACAIARRAWPAIKILGLSSEASSPPCLPPISDQVISALDGPQLLLRKATDMLGATLKNERTIELTVLAIASKALIHVSLG
jgi:hypothetical protein